MDENIDRERFESKHIRIENWSTGADETARKEKYTMPRSLEKETFV
jgi:hypothetical protein